MDILNDLLPTLEHIGIFGYLVVFLVALSESLAFVGSFVPGSAVVIFAGVLAARGYFDFGALILFVAIGAILGDSISYWLGTKGTKFFRNENKFLKLAHLERGKVFFARHGPKSIFFGRFIGPIRSIVPFIAGLSKMKQRTFLFWNVLGGLLWAIIHVSLGYFFGGVLHSAEAWVSRGGLVIISSIVVVVLVWVIVKKSKPILAFFSWLFAWIKKEFSSNPYLVRCRARYPRTALFLEARFARDQFMGLPLTLLSLAFLYVMGLFLGIVQGVVASEAIVSLDVRIANLLFAFRDTDLVSVFLWVTLLGKWQVIFGFTLVASALFWLWGKRVYLAPLWVVILGSVAVNFFGKMMVQRLRPELAVYAEKSFSFPSWHATIAVAFYGFLAYVLWQHDVANWKRRANILFVTTILILAIGFSRLYLGVHFLSDVLAGYLLGALWLIIGISVSKWLIATEKMSRFIERPFLNRKIISVALILVAIFFYGFVGARYHPINQMPTEEQFQQVADENIFGAFSEYGLPYQTETLAGNIREPINIMILVKNEDDLVGAMMKAGWSRADDLTFVSAFGFLKAAFIGAQYPEAPLAPSFWNNKTHKIGFEKSASKEMVRQRHHVRFWQTNLQTKDGQFLYVGTVGFDKNIRQMLTYQIDGEVDAGRELLFSDLETAGSVVSIRKEQGGFVETQSTFDDGRFSTDGKIYVIYLK